MNLRDDIEPHPRLRFPTGLSMSAGTATTALLVSLGLVSSLWALAAGMFFGWILIELIAAALR